MVHEKFVSVGVRWFSRSVYMTRKAGLELGGEISAPVWPTWVSCTVSSSDV